MKIALVSFDFGEYCIRLASGLVREAEVLLLLPQELAEADVSRLDPAVHVQLFSKPRLRQPLRQTRTIYSILRHIRDFDPDVVHFQHRHLWFNLALPLLERYPLVLTIHDPRHHTGDQPARKTPQAITDFGYHRADQIIVHNTQSKQVVVTELGIPGEIVHIIPHIAIGDDTAEYEVQEGDNLILFFGRIWPYKGLEYLIRAEPLITAEVPEARIVIAGQGENFARYQHMMVHPEYFIVHNRYVSDRMRTVLFRRASVVVLPYVEASQSGVIPLAHTFAKPVVATTVGGLPEQVDHGRTGYLVAPCDEKALADSIVRLLQDKQLRRELGANGKRKIDTECSADSVAKQTLAVYCRAIDAVRVSGVTRRSNRQWADTSIRMAGRGRHRLARISRFLSEW